MDCSCRLMKTAMDCGCRLMENNHGLELQTNAKQPWITAHTCCCHHATIHHSTKSPSSSHRCLSAACFGFGGQVQHCTCLLSSSFHWVGHWTEELAHLMRWPVHWAHAPLARHVKYSTQLKTEDISGMLHSCPWKGWQASLSCIWLINC